MWQQVKLTCIFLSSHLLNCFKSFITQKEKEKQTNKCYVQLIIIVQYILKNSTTYTQIKTNVDLTFCDILTKHPIAHLKCHHSGCY